jgi:hypothetical protein
VRRGLPWRGGGMDCSGLAARPVDNAVLRLVLKVKDSAGRDYRWVECGACDSAWQVPHYAESIG